MRFIRARLIYCMLIMIARTLRLLETSVREVWTSLVTVSLTLWGIQLKLDLKWLRKSVKKKGNLKCWSSSKTCYSQWLTTRHNTRNLQAAQVMTLKSLTNLCKGLPLTMIAASTKATYILWSKTSIETNKVRSLRKMRKSLMSDLIQTHTLVSLESLDMNK